jgi:hypothetical protein
LYSFRPAVLTAVNPSGLAPILPSDFAVSHYAGVSVGVEKYIYKWKYGTLSALVNYQAAWSGGASSGGRDVWDFDHGVGGGVCFYLSRIAIPAVSVTLNYNIAKSFFSAGFALGMSF